MGLINLTVYPRSSTGKNENRRTRAKGRTPAVVYGNDRETATNLEFDTYQIKTALTKAAGKSSLLSLTMDGESEPFVAVLKETQRHPVTDEIFHCDLFEIPLGVPLKTDVFIDYVGDNKHIRSGEAILEVIERSIEVECLPRNLPDSFTIDISEMVIGDKITSEDLASEGVTILSDLENVLVKMNANTFEELEVEEEEGEEGEAGEGAEGEGEDKESEETKED
jgi:large subunit ribosomal protein L25